MSSVLQCFRSIEIQEPQLKFNEKAIELLHVGRPVEHISLVSVPVLAIVLAKDGS